VWYCCGVLYLDGGPLTVSLGDLDDGCTTCVRYDCGIARLGNSMSSVVR